MVAENPYPTDTIATATTGVEICDRKNKDRTADQDADRGNYDANGVRGEPAVLSVWSVRTALLV
ncbi:hypothetical protein BDB13_0424 [Rhodococcus sp. OK302]|nr:hypothetical protein BDB13_0424 [Rhodococcus sp. OK302]